MTEFKYISSITESELNTNTVIPCIDEEGCSCILIKNASNKTVYSTYTTDNLEVKLNRKLIKDSNVFYVHVIKNKKIDLYSKRQFEVIYNYIFKKILLPVSDVELAQLITSLEDYFKTTPEKDRTTYQTGVYGELFTLIYLYDNGYTEIIDKFHTNFYSKHDVEINSKIRLEIKTVSGDKRIHNFRHNQICRDDIDLFISSVMLECVKYGTSLYELFDRVKKMNINPDLDFALEKLMIKCGVSEEDQGIRCSLDLAKENIRFYNSNDLPHLDKYAAKIEGLSNISYDVDCELAKNKCLEEILECFKSENLEGGVL